ncbi:MAG: HAD-IA family hydrolase [Nitrosomonadales bacterium]
MSKLIIFDWDGTIVDSTSHIVNAVNFAAKKTLKKEKLDTEIKQVIGLSLVEAFKFLFGAEYMDQFDYFRDEYKKYYVLDRPQMFQGIELVLKELKKNNYQLAVATGKSRKGLENDINVFQLTGMFDSTQTVDECFSKPNPQMIENILKELGFEKNNTLMVGDSIHDQKMAANANVDFLAVLYGVLGKNDFESQDKFLYAETVFDILYGVKKWNN